MWRLLYIWLIVYQQLNPLSASNSVYSFFLKMLLREHKVRETWLGKNRTLIIAL
jgi:hypothetical protein